MASITVQNIRKSFGTTPVLHDINLEIKDGEFLSLLGSSGCGKSTLLRIIAGLERESGGKLLIGGKSMSNISPKDRGVSMVFQSYALYPHLTVFENIAMPLIMRKLGRLQRLPVVGKMLGNARTINKEILEKVTTLAESLDIDSLLDRKPSQLSGGQRQRVALGRAMVREPEVFLMDEPLSNLDSKMRAHMRTELAELHRSLGTTFVYVTHDQEEAMTMSDRVALMMDGEILQVSSPREIYRNPIHMKVAEFIGTPKINILPCSSIERGVADCFGFKIKTQSSAKNINSLGIRPSRLKAQPRDSAGCPAQVINVEDLGSSFLVHAIIADSVRVISRMDSRAHIPVVGEEICFTPQEDCGIFFDEEGWNVNNKSSRQMVDACQEQVSESADRGYYGLQPSAAV